MVESRRKRRPDFLTRTWEGETEDALGGLFFGVWRTDIALDGKTLDLAFRPRLYMRYEREVVTRIDEKRLRAGEESRSWMIDRAG